MKKLLWILVLTLCLPGLLSTATAQSSPVAQVDVNAEIAAALYAASATLAAASRVADEKLREQRNILAPRDAWMVEELRRRLVQ